MSAKRSWRVEMMEVIVEGLLCRQAYRNLARVGAMMTILMTFLVLVAMVMNLLRCDTRGIQRARIGFQ